MLLAVHISDGVLQPTWLVAGWLAAGLLVWLGCRKMSDEEIPRIAVLSAAFFVASWIHVTMPGGASVHLLLNGLLGVVLGLRSAVAIPLGLFFQAVLFNHGGLTSLGVNSCVMTLPAIAAWLAFRMVVRLGWLRAPLPRWLVGFFLGGLTVLTTALLNALVLWFGAGEDLAVFAQVTFIAHLPVAGIEALIMGTIVSFLWKVKPEMLEIRNQ